MYNISLVRSTLSVNIKNQKNQKFVPSIYCFCNWQLQTCLSFPIRYPYTLCLQEEIDNDCAVAMLWPEVFQSEDTEKNISLGIKENFDGAKEDDVKEENTNENKVIESGLTQVR